MLVFVYRWPRCKLKLFLLSKFRCDMWDSEYFKIRRLHMRGMYCTAVSGQKLQDGSERWSAKAQETSHQRRKTLTCTWTLLLNCSCSGPVSILFEGYVVNQYQCLVKEDADGISLLINIQLKSCTQTCQVYEEYPVALLLYPRRHLFCISHISQILPTLTFGRALEARGLLVMKPRHLSRIQMFAHLPWI